MSAFSLGLSPDGLVGGPTRPGRVGVISVRGRALKTRRALPSQTREQATALAKGDGPFASSGGFSPFFVEDVEGR
jgi:hypothetical protein